MMDDVTKRALRTAIIAGSTDCVLSQEEAAAFLGIAVSTLSLSDIPRSLSFGKRVYLKSECLKYVHARLTHTVQLAEKTA